MELVKKNLFGIITVVLLIFFVHITPGFWPENEMLLTLNRVIIFVIGILYIIKKIMMFIKNNPDFKPSESKTTINILGSIFSILIGLLFGLLLMLIINPSQAFPGFWTILKGGFGGLDSLGDMIYLSVPIILTGLSVAFAFRTGLFNIGAVGQFTMGAFVAVFIGVEGGFLGEINPMLHWGVALIGAMIAGGLWGAIPGLLKAYRNVNEVVASIMLNYVAIYLNTMLIKKFIYNSDYARAQDIASTAELPTWNLELLMPRSSINIGIDIAIVVVVILNLVLSNTTFGFELKAVGLNREASRYAGMNSKRNIVYSMVISGMIAGLGGAITFLVLGKHLKPENILLPQGFTGIAISLLGLSSPFGVLLAGLFYGSLGQGGYLLQLYDFQPEIIDIIIAVIIYASALALFLHQFVIKTLKKREMEAILNVDLDENSEGGDA